MTDVVSGSPVIRGPVVALAVTGDGHLIVHCGGAAGDLMASAEYEWHHADEHKQHGNPEPTEHGGEPPGHEEANPEHGDPELDREQNQPQEQDPTLFPAGQAGGDGGLVGLVNALAVLDRRADPRPPGLIEAILEGKPPFGVASLLNHAVHRAWLRSYAWLEGEAGAAAHRLVGEEVPPYSSPVLPGSCLTRG